MTRSFLTLTISSLLILSHTQSNATLLDDVGYTDLLTRLGASTPDGSDVTVGIVEAHTNVSGTETCTQSTPENCLYRPDKSVQSYADSEGAAAVGEGFDHSFGLGLGTGFSGHATSVANQFYGSGSSSSGITEVHVFSAAHWLTSGYLGIGTSLPSTSSIRVSNHSYAGSVDTSDQVELDASVDALKRIEWIVDQDEQVTVVANTVGALNGTSYNAIAVGRTDGGSSLQSVDLGTSLYNSSQRARPDIVVPESTHSGATPRVASAAALLVETAHNAASGSAAIINGKTIYEAERAETIKAILMAGASRETQNTDGRPDITDYRSVGHTTQNGLDDRFGAGQLDIDQSHKILEAGQQEAGLVSTTGFDYVSHFGGENGSPESLSYQFSVADDLVEFAASLVWNVGFLYENENDFSTYELQLFDLNLSLFDDATDTLIASSTSTIDNTENLWRSLAMGTYRLEVDHAEVGIFDQDFALAWRVTAVPVPPALLLFLSGLIGLGFFRRHAT